MTRILVVLLTVATAANVVAIARTWPAGTEWRRLVRLRAERQAKANAPAPVPVLVREAVPPRPPALPLFPAPPRALQPAPRTDHRGSWFYVPQPGPSSFEWAGADWAGPTSLDFETHVMHARRFGARADVPAGTPLPPQELVRAVVDVWRVFLREVAAGDVVVDQDAPIGVAVVPESVRGPRPAVGYVVRALCWPKVEGVTIPRRRGWQDVTL